MNRLIMLRTDGSIASYDAEQNVFDQARQLLGTSQGTDTLEFVHTFALQALGQLTAPDILQMIVDESGRLKDLPVNPYASALYDPFGHQGVIAGHVVFAYEPGRVLYTDDDVLSGLPEHLHQTVLTRLHELVQQLHPSRVQHYTEVAAAPAPEPTVLIGEEAITYLRDTFGLDIP